jgi:hypothetical protein
MKPDKKEAKKKEVSREHCVHPGGHRQAAPIITPASSSSALTFTCEQSQDNKTTKLVSDRPDQIFIFPPC